MDRRPTTILLTGVGGPTPRSIARALKLYGRFGPYRIVGCDADPLAIGLYDKNLVDRGYLVPTATAPDYWTAIGRIVAEEGVDLAVVQPEAEVEAWAERAADRLPCPALLPPAGLVRELRDKARLAELLAGTDLVPSTIRLDPDGGNLDEVARRLGRPFWIRSALGSSGLRSLKVEDTASARRWLALHAGATDFIASPFLPGRNLACKLLYRDGELLRAACAERVHYVMAKIAPSGITGNTSFGRLLSRPDVVELSSHALAVLGEALGAPPHGLLTVDLKEDREGWPRVTEVNVRAVAFVGVFAAAGANIAEDLVRLTLGDREVAATFHHYRFDEPLVFLRDVDALPIVMPERALLRRDGA